ncbi:group III truncated hemoglobin [Leadbetterella sp. DM7]|uniref:group III truncated hemoglobin n=1 Tax=Leadbetterella sp. DM7 TaxID=3235085 RepID=UPI00349EA8EA
MTTEKPTERKDISSREDLRLLIDTFYDGVLNDPVMRPVFEDSLPHWDHHKERVVNFWENWLFQTGAYDGGMMWKHSARHQTQPMTTGRFERWLAYWFTTTDQLFEGKNAEFVKSKALEIGKVLHHKLNAV